MSGLFRTVPRRTLPVDPNEEKRPSNWNKEVNEIELDPQLEYPTPVDSPVDAPDMGFPPPPNPTPVYLTETPPTDRTIRQWTAGNVGATAVAQQLSGSDRRRKRMVVTNAGDTNELFVTRRQADLTFNGYLLEPNQSIELFHNDEVWCLCSPTETTTVTWLTEFELEH